MDYAHRRGVIHGDIKPENCLLTNYGILKISGFGLTKISGIVTPELGNLDISNLMEGSIILFEGRVGTPEYMAPEQFEGRADFSSDIYSFGVMLFEMVCGRRPYVMPKEIHQGARVLYYEKAHKEVIPPNPKDLRPDCPEGLRRLILQCLEKEKEKRPKSFKEIEDKIIKLYKEITKEDYFRPKIDEMSLIVSDLNNRALSLLDLGKKEEAENLLRQAVEKDPVHPVAVYNLALLEWRSGRIDDLEAVKRIKEVCKSYPGEWLPIYLLASFYLERGDNEKALSVLEEIKNVNHEIKELYSLAQSSPGIKCLRTFQGHNWPVISVCFSQDGKYVLSGSSDHTLKLWDVETGKCLRTFGWHSGTVNSVSFSPDGKFALSGSEDKTLKLWDVKSGECLRTFEGHRDAVTSACFSPDGRYALSGSSDKTLKLWDVKTGECLKTFKGHRDAITSVCFSPDGRYALSGSWDDTLKLWDVETGKCLKTFEGHESGVTSLCFSPDGRYALSGSWDDTLKLWDVKSGECIRTFKGHKWTVNSVCFSPDGKYALSGSSDYTLKLWDVETGECLRTFEGHKDSVNSVCFSPDGKYALSASGELYGAADYTLRLWDIKTGKCLRTFGWHKWPIFAVCFSPDGRYILAESWDEALKLWVIDWELEEKEPADWDEEARPYLEIFLTLRTSYGPDSYTRQGEPQWTEEDFQKLLQELRYRGYGWLRPEGVRKKLEELSKEKSKKNLLNFNLLRRLIKRMFCFYLL